MLSTALLMASGVQAHSPPPPRMSIIKQRAKACYRTAIEQHEPAVAGKVTLEAAAYAGRLIQLDAHASGLPQSMVDCLCRSLPVSAVFAVLAALAALAVPAIPAVLAAHA